MASIHESQPSVGMNTIQFRDMTLAQIIVSVPGAAAKLRTHGIDFYRDLGVALEEVAATSGFQLESLEAELAASSPVAEEAELAECKRLIEHILTRYHDTHRRDLPVLVDMARRVEEVHRTHAAVPTGLSRMLQELRDELESHMLKEEEVLFPMMLAGGHPMIVYPIERMLMEHNEHTGLLEHISRITNDFRLPADACGTWRALYSGLQTLLVDLRHHIQLENNLLFPQFTQRKPSGAGDRLI